MEQPASASQRIAHVVSRALTDAGISQREAATRTGIPVTTLHRRLTGTSSLSITELAALSALIGVSVTEVVRQAESPDWGTAA